MRIQIPKGLPRQKMYIKFEHFRPKLIFIFFLLRAIITLQNTIFYIQYSLRGTKKQSRNPGFDVILHSK
jgi:hypothetical protein